MGGRNVSESGEQYATLPARLAPLGAVAVAVLAQVVMRDRIVLGPLLLAPVIEITLGAVTCRSPTSSRSRQLTRCR
jgi:hypothetical protein